MSPKFENTEAVIIKLSSALSLIAVLSGIYVTFFSSYYSDINEIITAKLEISKLDETNISTKRIEPSNKINILSKRLASMEKELGNAIQVASVKTLENYEIAFKKIPVVESEISKLRKELKGLKEVIVGNPDATLTLGAIKKDIETLKKSDDRMYQDLNNYATLGMWIIGILITVSLALFGFSIAAHIRNQA